LRSGEVLLTLSVRGRKLEPLMHCDTLTHSTTSIVR
jgi:hypothetical protein